MSRKVWPLAAALVVVASRANGAEGPAADAPDPGAALFAERCSTCHNIGGGPKIGPDLLGVIKRRDRAWLARFVRGPSRMIDGGDPIAAELYRKFAPVRMPDQALTDAEVAAVWTYFAACTDKGGCQPVPLGPRWGTDGTDDEIARGRGLFLGELHLQKGGAPCFACHNVRGEGVMGGGTLGPDLTFAYARLGEKGTPRFLAAMGPAPAGPGPVAPVMSQIYAGVPLDEGEQLALKTYLAHVARDGTPAPRERNFLLLGVEGMGLALGAVTLRAGRRRGRAPNSAGGDGAGDAGSASDQGAAT